MAVSVGTEPASVRTRRRRPRLVVALVVFVSAVAAGAIVSRPEPAPGEHTVGERVGLAVGVAGRPEPAVAVAPAKPPLPIPEALPENPYAPTPQVVVGTIEIPKLGLVDDIQHGVTLTAINRGPGWWPGTAEPGGWGNSVIAGHRTTYSKPFARLNELEPGDQVVITTDDGRFVYEVRGVITVPGDWIDIAAQSEAHTATLFACHPPGSARERIVAKLKLLDDQGAPVDDEADLPAMDAEAQRTEHTLVVRPSTDIVIGSGSGSDPFAEVDG
jgi:LPXTG-site transpeptidase (sortase) family protein